MPEILGQDIDSIVNSASIDWSRFAGKTVLITGANGMLGSYLVRTLLALNEHLSEPVRVLALCRSQGKAETVFADVLHHPQFALHIHDITDPLSLNEPVHYIIHAASQASPKCYGGDPVGTFAPNVIGTQYLLQLAHEQPIEAMLFVSSSEVYGINQFERISESDYGLVDPLNVRSCYAEGKRAGETLCVAWHHQYGVPVSIVRPFHCYGPSMRLDDGRVYADFVAALVRGEPIRLNSDGSARRAFCYITDATRAFFTVLLSGALAEAYNVANPDAEVSILALAQELAALFPERNVAVEAKAPMQDGSYLISEVKRSSPAIDKLAALGWRPTVGIAEGFKRTIESFNEAG